MINEFKGLGYERNGSDALRPPKTPVPPPASRAESQSRTLTLTSERVELSQAGLEASRGGVEAIRRVERLSATEVVDRVAGFVESRIQEEARNGASSERISELLNQAREGLATGYGEALDIIEDQGLLTPELESDIETGRQGILDRLDALESRLLGEPEVEPKKAASAPQAVSPERTVSDARPASRVDAQAFQGREDRYAIEIRTRDGDVVTLSSQALSAAVSGISGQSDGSVRSLSAFNATYSQSGYAFQVEGELDDQEFKAIEDFVRQVQRVAEEFFNGDFESAFNSALELRPDVGEIAAFAVSLSTTQVQGYQSKAGGSPARVSPYQPLADQAARVRDALRTAEPFENRPQLLEQLVDVFVRQKERSSAQLQAYLEFTRELSERLEKQLYQSFGKDSDRS